MVDISGGPCKDHNYVLEQIHLHWGEDDNEGSEHLINANPFAAEVRNSTENKGKGKRVYIAPL